MAENNLPETTKKQKTEIQQYSLTSAGSILKMADELTRFIKERKLIQNIQGKEFVLVEAWTFAGMSMGLMPIPVKVTNLSTPDELKYEAVVELLNIHTNQVVGRGFAICSNKENGKKHFAEYAIASMAQTRATSKAYRLPLGFLMKAAGFEATPAEEMEFQQAEVVTQTQSEPVMVVDNLPAKATELQKTKILKLINNPCITKEARKKMQANIDKITEERAAESIIKLEKAIKEQEPIRTDLAKELFDLATLNCELLGEKRTKELYDLANSGSAEELAAAKEQATEFLANAAA